MLPTPSPKDTLHLCATIALDWVLAMASARGTPTDLTGLCAKGAAFLHGLLEARGLTAKIVVWQTPFVGHCYVECEGHLLDVTASQFGCKPLEIHALADKPKRNFWRGRVHFNSSMALVAYLERHQWADEQLPALA